MIELAYFGGFSHSKIAEMLDAPIGTVKGRMRLGLDKLRQQLAEEARVSVERHDIQQENVGAYLLGALTDHEETSFLRHLEECPVCSDEVARLRPAVDALPRSVTPVEPPPALKSSIMKVVEAEARHRSSARAGAAPASSACGSAPGPGGDGRGTHDIRPGAAWAGAAALLMIGAITGYGVTQLGSEGETLPGARRHRRHAAPAVRHRPPHGPG